MWLVCISLVLKMILSLKEWSANLVLFIIFMYHCADSEDSQLEKYWHWTELAWYYYTCVIKNKKLISYIKQYFCFYIIPIIIPCSCNRIYISQNGHLILSSLKEHKKCVKNMLSEKSAAMKHSVSNKFRQAIIVKSVNN